jgi:hypothetical protein
MFSVKWVAHHKEAQPIAVENSVFTDLDKIVASCKEDLYGMRLRHIATPPDGFIVCDVDGRELRRWFGPLPIEPSRTERFKSQEVGT